MGPFSSLRTAACAALLTLMATAGPLAIAAKPDLLTDARRFYNLGQYDRALETATQAAASSPTAASSARLIMGRARLERYRQSFLARELEDARTDLRAVDPRALEGRERIELQVGLGELLYLEDRFGPAAELLDPLVDASMTLAPDAHDRALDWWATAVDRQAQSLSAADRAVVYPRIIARMEQELRRDPLSAPASYWLAAAARAAGDLERAWAAASAGWIRASLAGERGHTLRDDLDKLVTQALIPDRAAKTLPRDRRQSAATMFADWEAFKKAW